MPTEQSTRSRGQPRRGRLLAWTLIAAGVATVAMRLDTGPEPNDGGASAVAALVAQQVAPGASRDAAAQFCALLLAEADRKLAQVNAVHAVFRKRERIDGKLQEINVMDLKARRSPKSVYLRWREPNEGREITWQEDAHDGQIVVRVGGWRRKIVPLLKIDPLSERAMQYSRRPVTGVGLWSFNARLRQFVEEEVPRGSWRTELREDVSLSGRPCYCFKFSANSEPASEIQAAAVNSDQPHRQVLIYIDKELGLPIACERFGPPTPDALEHAALEESYAFTDLQLNLPVSDREFDLAAEQEANVARKP